MAINPFQPQTFNRLMAPSPMGGPMPLVPMQRPQMAQPPASAPMQRPNPFSPAGPESFMQRLAPALTQIGAGFMSGNPGQGMALAGQMMEQQRQQRLKQAQAPKRQVLKDAAGFQRFVDTGERVFPGAEPTPEPPDPKDWQNLRKTYRGEQDVKDYQAIRSGYEKLRSAAQTPSGPGDISMLVGFMKMLDPGSVVREGEFATAENAGGVSAQVRGLYNRIIGGERLTPELRAQFLAEAERIHNETAENLRTINEMYGGQGPDTSFMTQPETYEPINPAKLRDKYGLE